jgi:hypothetical protein
MIGKHKSEEFASSVVRKASGAEWNRLRDAYVLASQAAYVRATPPDLWAAWLAYPGVFSLRADKRVAFQGQSLGLIFSNMYFGAPGVGWKNTGEHDQLFPKIPDSYLKFDPVSLDQVVAARDVFLELNKTLQERVEKLQRTVQSHSSWKALAKAWPELAPEIPADWISSARVPSTALANYSALNAEIGLPLKGDTK